MLYNAYFLIKKNTHSNQSRSIITACSTVRRSFFFSIGGRHRRQLICKDTTQSTSRSVQTFTWENWSHL